MTSVLIFDFAESLMASRAPGTAGSPAPRDPARARSSRLMFSDPIDVLRADDLSTVRAVLREAEAAARRGCYAAGFVSYDASPAFDPAYVVRTADRAGDRARDGAGSRSADVKASLPLAWFGIYRAPATGAEPAAEPRPPYSAAPAMPTLEPSIDREAYDRAVTTIREAIAEGDVYQVNYTFPLRGRVGAADASPAATRALYERLAREGHGGYAAYLDIGTHRLLSFSPELFFECVPAPDGGARAICRPMKGTVARGRWAEEDAARAAWLEASEKNRAENVMIVDLVRNDLGRVARVGGVRVASLCAIERYPTVWQMTSTIEAELRADTTIEAIFEALFPCGSVTGAPKISALQHIAALESSTRGAYCGAIGIIGPDRTVFNVAIRTLTIDAAACTATYPVGGGVTWDSRSREEYAEARAKAALLQPRPTFQLLETMRVDEGIIVREARHLTRMISSARYFGFVATDEAAEALRVRARDTLRAQAAAHPHGSWRLRLRVSASGEMETTIATCDAPAPHAAARVVALADEPVDPEDPFLCHKTTHRAMYDARRSAQPDAFDVLLHNTRGELTEFTIGNLVLSLDGARVTPPRASGLLAGTFRDTLLEAGVISERLLTLDDLRRANGMWLINSVREWVPVVLRASTGTPSSQTDRELLTND